MSVEQLKSIFDVATVLVAALAALLGAGALITGNILNNRQAEQLRQFDRNLTDAKAANLKLEALIQPRYLNGTQRHEIEISMRRFAGHGVLIASAWTDLEAARLAKQIKSSLNLAGIGIGSTFDSMTLDKIGGYPEIITGLWGGGGGTVGMKILRNGVSVWGSDREAVTALANALPQSLTVSTPPQSENPYFGSVQKEYASMPLAVFVGSKPIPEAE